MYQVWKLIWQMNGSRITVDRGRGNIWKHGWVNIIISDEISREWPGQDVFSQNGPINNSALLPGSTLISLPCLISGSNFALLFIRKFLTVSLSIMCCHLPCRLLNCLFLTFSVFPACHKYLYQVTLWKLITTCFFIVVWDRIGSYNCRGMFSSLLSKPWPEYLLQPPKRLNKLLLCSWTIKKSYCLEMQKKFVKLQY